LTRYVSVNTGCSETLEAGDRVLFVTDEAGNVCLTSPKTFIHAVWANNHGGNGGDSGDDVRRMRDNDRQQMQEISEQDALDTRTNDEVTDAVLQALITNGG